MCTGGISINAKTNLYDIQKAKNTSLCMQHLYSRERGHQTAEKVSDQGGGCGVHLIYRLKEVASFQWCEDVDGQDVVTSKNGSREWMCSGGH